MVSYRHGEWLCPADDVIRAVARVRGDYEKDRLEIKQELAELQELRRTVPAGSAETRLLHRKVDAAKYAAARAAEEATSKLAQQIVDLLSTFHELTMVEIEEVFDTAEDRARALMEDPL